MSRDISVSRADSSDSSSQCSPIIEYNSFDLAHYDFPGSPHSTESSSCSSDGPRRPYRLSLWRLFLASILASLIFVHLKKDQLAAIRARFSFAADGRLGGELELRDGDQLEARVEACAAIVEEKDVELSRVERELRSIQSFAESRFWLGLGANSWTAPKDHRRHAFGHTSLTSPLPPSSNRTSIRISSFTFSPSSPSLLTTPTAEIIGFSIQLAPASLTRGEWRASFLRGGTGTSRSLKQRRVMSFEAKSGWGIWGLRWAIMGRCWGFCGEFGDPTFFANVYLLVDEV